MPQLEFRRQQVADVHRLELGDFLFHVAELLLVVLWCHFGAIGIAGEALTLAMDLIGSRPRPTAELVALVIVEGLHQFIAGIHHKRPVLRYRLVDGTALQHQQAGRLGAVADGKSLVRAQPHAVHHFHAAHAATAEL